MKPVIPILGHLQLLPHNQHRKSRSWKTSFLSGSLFIVGSTKGRVNPLVISYILAVSRRNTENSKEKNNNPAQHLPAMIESVG